MWNFNVERRYFFRFQIGELIPEHLRMQHNTAVQLIQYAKDSQLNIIQNSTCCMYEFDMRRHLYECVVVCGTT